MVDSDILALIGTVTVVVVVIAVVAAFVGVGPLGAYGIPGDIEQSSFGYAQSGPPHIY